MRDPRLRNLLQNAALLLLTASALLLLARLPLLQSIRLSAPPLFTAESGGEEGDAPPAAMFASVNLMATRDSDEYGRCGLLYAGMEDETLQEVIPLFQEALGSAVPAGAVEDTALREALNHPGLYLELTGGPLSLEAVAAWLGEDAYLSLFAVGGNCRVTETGVEYPLTNHLLTGFYPLGVSNHILDTAKITARGGTLLVMLCRGA